MNSNKCIKWVLHLVENPVAFRDKYVYNVMGAEKNKRRSAAFVFFKPVNEQPVCVSRQ